MHAGEPAFDRAFAPSCYAVLSSRIPSSLAAAAPRLPQVAAMRAALATLLIAACVPIPVNAQQLTHRAGLSAPAPLRAELTRPLNAREVAPNNWLKGMLIGAGIGLLWGWFIDGVSENAGTTYVLASAGVCAFIGSLIGSAFRKH